VYIDGGARGNPGFTRVRAHDVGQVTCEHVWCALNAHADRLANAAMDEAGSLR